MTLFYDTSMTPVDKKLLGWQIYNFIVSVIFKNNINFFQARFYNAKKFKKVYHWHCFT